MKNKELLNIIQLGIAGVIFLLFGAGVLFSVTNVTPYLLIPLLIGNIVFLFVNKTKGLISDILMLLLIPLLFVVFVEYIATIIGTIVAFIHGLRLALNYYKGYKPKVEKE